MKLFIGGEWCIIKLSENHIFEGEVRDFIHFQVKRCKDNWSMKYWMISIDFDRMHGCFDDFQFCYLFLVCFW
jgi:hypothetical protein